MGLYWSTSAHSSTTGGYVPPLQPKNCCRGLTPDDLGYYCIFSSIRNNQRLWNNFAQLALVPLAADKCAGVGFWHKMCSETTPACSALTRNATGVERGLFLGFWAYPEHLNPIWAQMGTKNQFQAPSAGVWSCTIALFQASQQLQRCTGLSSAQKLAALSHVLTR